MNSPTGIACVQRTIVSVGMIALAQTVPMSIAAQTTIVPGKGGQDPFGPYEPVPGWPRDFSTLPGYEDWTWGAAQGIFAESADRIFILQRGILKKIDRPENRLIDDQGTLLRFPVGRQYPWRDGTLPWRDGTTASPDHNNEDGWTTWEGAGYRRGIDARWEHCLVIVDREGNIVETWSQWDSMFMKPHAVHMNPYDPEKHVWVVDDFAHAIYKFSNDGKVLVQTLGTYGESGNDEHHFGRPTFMAFLPDAILVADGYVNSRVVKFDNEGNYLMEWGQEGILPDDTRPGYFNSLHGIGIDPESGRIYINDRQNNRMQVFDENGNFIDQWSFGESPTDAQYLIVANGAVWVGDAGTTKFIKYDLDGRFQYSWGSWGTFPGGVWGVHGMSADEEGNFYIAEVNNGRVQKFRPRPGVDPSLLIGRMVVE